MSELKPCANCAGEATWQAPNMHRKTRIACKECGMSTGWGTVEEVTATWNRRAQPDNDPLTLEQLREMDGEPVWVTHKDGSGGRWGVVNKYRSGLCADVCSGYAYWFDDFVGTLAYRRKPEGSENNA